MKNTYLRIGLGTILLFGLLVSISHLVLNRSAKNPALVISAISNPPELPRVYVDTTMPTQTGATINVANNCTGLSNCQTNLQTAINNAQPGDTIVLRAGDTFNGKIDLPNKPNPNNKWIVIQSSKLSSLPPSGTRVSLADAVNMPTISAGTNIPNIALQALNSANYYRIIGVRFIPGSNVYTTQLVVVGENSNTSGGQPNTIAELPHHIVFDRVIASGDPTVGGRRAFRLDGRMQAVVDSYINNWWDDQDDTQAIASVWGADGIKVVNNYLEAAGENLFFGGGGGYMPIPGINPSDIEIRNNYLYKPPVWKTGGKTVLVKNLFELKAGERILAEGNVLDGSWAGVQDGKALNFKSTNQDGYGDNTYHTGDVIFRYNLVRNMGEAGSLLGIYPGPAQVMSNVEISNNLFENMNVSPYISGQGDTWYMSGGTNIALRHNTFVTTGSMNSAMQLSPMATNVDIDDNIFMNGAYGFKTSGASGNNTLPLVFTNYTFSNNAIIGTSYPIGSSSYPLPSLSAAGFADYTNGDWRIVSGPLLGGASDGKDVGADIAMIKAKTAGVINGTPGSGTYTPPPPSAPSVSLSANPTTVTPTSSGTKLTWSAFNATSCNASGGYGWSGAMPTSGSMDILSITNTTTFTLDCTGSGGSASKSTTVTYSSTVAPAPTLNFSVTPAQISTDSVATLTWSSTDATSCTASGSGYGWTGTQPTSGSFTTWHISATAVFYLTCTGSGGSVTKSATVTYGSTTPTPTLSVSLSAFPTSITAGQSSTLSWTSTNTTSCSGGEGWAGTKAVTGSEVVAPTATKTYTITCSDSAGATQSASATVTVSAVTVPDNSVSLSAFPTSITAGQSSTLSWTSTNMTSCAASGGWSGTKALSGSEVVSPSIPTTYSLYCNGAAGTKSASVTVDVSAVTQPPSSTGISIGDTIMVIVHRLNVRARPTIYAQRLGTQYEGSTGIVNDGPVYADGYTWWNVDFGYGVDGWVAAEGNIQESSPVVPLTIGSNVTTTDSVNVRSTPEIHGNNKLGRQVVGSQGKIIDGPALGSGYTWWNIDFLYDPDGWVAADYIR